MSADAAGVRVGVLDYGSGNLHSACRALAVAGGEVVLSADAGELGRCDALVVPGVGAFAACMEGLRAVGGDEIVAGWVEGGRPLLGICVGHQVLFERGVEHGLDSEGLGVFPGTVERLTSARLPHMGWNLVEAGAGATAFRGGEADRFYFVHSYGVHTPVPGATITWCEHGGDRFVAAVERGAVTSTQFHPEKSGAAGGRLLRNWIGSVRS